MTPPPDRVSQRCVCPAAGCTAHMQTPAEYEERTSGVRTTIELGQWVDEMCAIMAETATEHLHKLGLKGTVVVNVEWTNDVKEGWMCIGSKIPPGASPLLAMSLRASADEIDGEEV